MELTLKGVKGVDGGPTKQFALKCKAVLFTCKILYSRSRLSNVLLKTYPKTCPKTYPKKSVSVGFSNGRIFNNFNENSIIFLNVVVLVCKNYWTGITEPVVWP